MKNSRLLIKPGVVVFTILLAILAASCDVEPQPSQQVWIDYPRQGDQFSPDSSIPITFHVNKDENIAEISITVNGEVIFTGPPPPNDEPVYAINQEWTPAQPGDYTIAITVKNIKEEVLSKAQVDIGIPEGLELLKPDLRVTNVSVEGTDRIRCDFENIGGAVLPAGRDVWIDIILGPAESELPPVSRSNIGVGDSIGFGDSRSFFTAPLSPPPSWPHLVTCRIDVDDDITESDETNNQLSDTIGLLVTLPAPSTEPPPPPQPPPTTQAPPTQKPPTSTPSPTTDSTPPVISNLSWTPDRIAENPCQQNTVTITAQVSDPSGLDQVILYFRAAKGGTTGSWQNLSMRSESGNQYYIVLGPNEIGTSQSPYGGLNLEFYVKAWDSLGNFSQSSSGSLPLDYCVQ